MKQETFSQRLSKKKFEYEVRFMFWRMCTIDRFLKWFYCRRGWHKLRPNSLRISKSIGTTNKMRCILDAHWLECIKCERLFFDDKKQRDKYARYQEREKQLMQKLFKRTMKEHAKERGINHEAD